MSQLSSRHKEEMELEDTNELLRKLVDMLSPGANTTMKAPELSTLDKLVHLLGGNVVERKPALPTTQEPTKFETRLQSFLDRKRMPNQEFRQRPVQRDWSEVRCFSCGKSGHSATCCPTLDITFPFILPGWKAEKTSVGYMMISPRRAMDRRQAENAN